MKFKKGTMLDLEEVICFYDEVNDYLACHTNYPGWRKGIYPNRETAEEGITKGHLFVMKDEEHVVGSVILRHEPEEAYAKANWLVPWEYQDIFVVYTFAIHPNYAKRGLGEQLMNFVIAYSKEQHMKAIRLDVCEGNTPAILLYKTCGFQYIDTVDLGLKEFGLGESELYQKIL